MQHSSKDVALVIAPSQSQASVNTVLPTSADSAQLAVIHTETRHMLNEMYTKGIISQANATALSIQFIKNHDLTIRLIREKEQLREDFKVAHTRYVFQSSRTQANCEEQIREMHSEHQLERIRLMTQIMKLQDSLIQLKKYD